MVKRKKKILPPSSFSSPALLLCGPRSKEEEGEGRVGEGERGGRGEGGGGRGEGATSFCNSISLLGRGEKKKGGKKKEKKKVRGEGGKEGLPRQVYLFAQGRKKERKRERTIGSSLYLHCGKGEEGKGRGEGGSTAEERGENEGEVILPSSL